MKYEEIKRLDQEINTMFASKTKLEDFIDEEPIASAEQETIFFVPDKKIETARRLLRQMLQVKHWTPARRSRALDTIYKLRPNKRQVIAYYISRGDHPAIARKLAEHYETLPVVHLTKKDFHVLRDIINGNVATHEPYIKRILK